MASPGPAVTAISSDLLKQRQALLDLSTRNRLLNIPRRTHNVRTVEIVDEKSSEIFRLLLEGKGLTFVPGRQLTEEERQDLEPGDKDTGGIPQPDEREGSDERGVAARHADTRLQTRLTSEGLQKRLFDIWYDARTLEEEQGVNILFLALGLVRWYEDEKSDQPRHAPLILLPVRLERSHAGERFRLKWRSEPPSPNLTLQAKIKNDFGVILEDFSDEDEFDFKQYFAHVTKAIGGCKRWEVLPDDMVLGFFSFAKFLMYRDLDPANWPDGATLETNPLVQGLLRDGFPPTEPLIPEDGGLIDPFLPAEKTHHVVDADSSQAIAIEEASSGRTLVIKGPPGTGKSQTITNIIAAAVAREKTVLFVAEKLAALEVVYRRLEKAGLGALALELHSNKANKRAVLEELRRTQQLQVRPTRLNVAVEEHLDASTAALNQFVTTLHAPIHPCGLSPYQILTRLALEEQEAGAPARLEGAASWTPADVAGRERAVAELAGQLLLLGEPVTHPWRGAQCDVLDRAEIRELAEKLGALLHQIGLAVAECETVANVLGGPGCGTMADIRLSLAFLNAAKELPERFDRRALSHEAWSSNLGGIIDLVRSGKQAETTRGQANQHFKESAWSADFASIRLAIGSKGKSLFRFLDSNYRSQIALLRDSLNGEMPKSCEKRLQLVGEIESAQTSESDFQGHASLGPALGSSWQGRDSDWVFLAQVLDWRRRYDNLPALFWQKLAVAESLNAVFKSQERLRDALSAMTSEIQAVDAVLTMDWNLAFAQAEVTAVPLPVLVERLEAWKDNLEALSLYVAYRKQADVVAALGIESLVDLLRKGKLREPQLQPAFQRAYSDVLRQEMFRVWPELKSFDGERWARSIAQFKDLDLQRMELARHQIAQVHCDGRPRGAPVANSPLGVLLGELAKRSRHLPIRVLLEKAGAAVQDLKPVFMMSPLSVAQFLKPGGIHFDVLVVDEASQVEPVDALGAVARAGQMIVVGDERQLPPTRFFTKLTSEADPDEDDEDAPTFEARDAESILDLCLAKGVPSRMLNWHYRSRHQSLIAVSNHEFYDDKLFIVPSPYSAIAGMGLRFHHLPSGVYDRGRTRTNPIEAKAVAEAVMQHARSHPEQSLGVATFSVAQRQQILRELELLRRADPSQEEFFEKAGAEPFFVKNLENIQGDERDVIFISVGYGKTETGYLAHNFGPLSNEGGERRLNVLISRAKRRCEVFSGIRGDDIDLERSRKRGVAAFKMFLSFAETGKFGQGEPTSRDHDSPFEQEVARRLRSLGYDVRSQIGIAGFFVDLAIADAEKPGRYVLGIECDGAQYHSSRSARDRDRLRQQVLESQDWIIHRIWSADWYFRPGLEMQKLEGAIASAKEEWKERDERGVVHEQAVPFDFGGERVEYIQPTGPSQPAPQSGFPAYRQASFPVDSSRELHEVSLGQLAEYVAEIVAVEGPIHVDEIVTRLRTLWGLQRAGARIRSRVGEALDICVRRGAAAGQTFYSVPGKTPVPRDRSAVTSSTLRRPEYLPSEEADVVLETLVDENYGAPREELLSTTARRLGFGILSPGLKRVLSDRVDDLVGRGALQERDGLLVRPESRPAV